MSPTPRIVRCPQCRKSTKYTADNPNLPFCSDRCKTTDLGSWADESYKIPTREPEMELENWAEDLNEEKKPQNPDQ